MSGTAALKRIWFRKFYRLDGRISKEQKKVRVSAVQRHFWN
ncbi:hypothetical protein [Companilactobacillus alimentarius]|nr:hypothetical protein [Companilactobacillus alimentarius]